MFLLLKIDIDCFLNAHEVAFKTGDCFVVNDHSWNLKTDCVDQRFQLVSECSITKFTPRFTTEVTVYSSLNPSDLSLITTRFYL